jgi:hypothetical protein
VTLDIAKLVDNGNTVPVVVSVDSPMTASDHVKAIAIFNERNPSETSRAFRLGPRAGRAKVETRIRLATSQKVTASRDDERRQRLVGHGRRRRRARRLPRGRHLMARAIVTVTQTAKRGDVIEIRTLIGHPMETGFRVTGEGARIPRDLIRKLTCRYNGASCSVRSSFPPSRRIRSSRSTRSRPRAAPWRSRGKATTASPRPRRSRSA